jgi:hypothetical protein
MLWIPFLQVIPLFIFIFLIVLVKVRQWVAYVFNLNFRGYAAEVEGMHVN